MPPRRMDEKKIKEEILNRLFRRGSWGHSYSNTQAIINWIGSKVKNNGKRVRKAIDQLAKDFLIFKHKKGKTISLNHRKKKEIMDILEDAFPI